MSASKNIACFVVLMLCLSTNSQGTDVLVIHPASLPNAHVYVAFSPDAKKVVTTGSTDGIRGGNIAVVWDAETGDKILQLQGHTDRIWSAVFSPCGEKILTGCDDHTARIWDSKTGKELAVLKAVSNAGGVYVGVFYASFFPDGNKIATAHNSIVHIWDSKSGEVLDRVEIHTGAIYPLHVSPNGETIVSASFMRDTTIPQIWDIKGKYRMSLQGHESVVHWVSFSPDGTMVVSASSDGTARIWNSNTGKEMQRLTSQQGPIRCALFSPSGERVITVGEGVQIWKLSEGKIIQELAEKGEFFKVAALSVDGRKLAVSSRDDGYVRIWTLEPPLL